jgi:S-adenosylmethionine:tRNA ribosyltransferase-isomerase
MLPAAQPIHRRETGRLLVVDCLGGVAHWRRNEYVRLFEPGDLVVANDAATLPASLRGRHVRTGRRIEVRLAGRDSLEHRRIHRFSAVLFGLGDFHMRTEDRPLPPPVDPGDRLVLGPLAATVTDVLDHPRHVALEFEGRAGDIWAGLARHGRPVQYSHLPAPLALCDVWTPIAGPPVAFEPPSSGFVLDWRSLAELRARGVLFATLTHAAGLSSTGDATLDARLPLDEPYWIPAATAAAIERTRESGGRVIAIGTTVVRALEAASATDGHVRAGHGVARQRIGPGSRLRVVDAVLSGTHESGTSHHDLLRAFANDPTVARMDEALERGGYLTHEYGDSIFLERGGPTMLT